MQGCFLNQNIYYKKTIIFFKKMSLNIVKLLKNSFHLMTNVMN